MRASSTIALIVTFTATIVASDYALAGALDIKLLDSMVFMASFLFGLRVGAAVGILSETIWSFASPWGTAGMMTPFLLAGEMLFVLAGWAASRVWGTELRPISSKAIYIGAIMAICAFVWDFETNAATALFSFGPHLTLGELLVTEFAPVGGGPFFIAHGVGDFLLGMLFVPAAIPLVLKVFRGRA